MVTGVPVAVEMDTIGDVIETIRTSTGDLDTFNYVYVTDAEEKLKGAVSIQVLLTAEPRSQVHEVMTSDLITAQDADDQEEVARSALRHHLKAVPVVGSDGRLRGVVPPHRILQILHQEHEEDILTEAGVDPATVLQDNQTVWQQVHQRLPWLMLGAVGGVAAALIVQSFESALAEEVLLAAFIPTIVYLADAVGVQVQTIYIRLTANEAVPDIVRYIFREIAISVVVAGVLGALTFALVWTWFETLQLSLIVGLAAAASIVFASVIAVLLPWIFQKVKLDPAVASGPFATIVRDIASIGIYFLLAHYLLQTAM